MFLSAPAVNPGGIWGPTTYATVGATPFAGVFKAPPFFPDGGSPSTSQGATPTWVDVELSQIGNVVTLTIDRHVILSYTNTVLANSGNIMIGYCDAYDSVLVGSAVVIDNLRVVRLAASLAPANITSIVPVGVPPTSCTINYTGGSGSKFVLLSSPTANASMSGWSRVATNSTGSGTFSVPAAGTQGFYRIKSE